MMTKIKLSADELNSSIIQFREIGREQTQESQDNELVDESVMSDENASVTNDENASVTNDEFESEQNSNFVDNETSLHNEEESVSEDTNKKQAPLSRKEQRAKLKAIKQAERDRIKKANLDEKEAKRKAKLEAKANRVNDGKLVPVLLATTKFTFTVLVSVSVCFVGYKYLEQERITAADNRNVEQLTKIAEIQTQIFDAQDSIGKIDVAYKAEMKSRNDEADLLRNQLEKLQLDIKSYVANSQSNLLMIEKIRSDIANNQNLNQKEVASIKHQLAALERETKQQSEDILEKVKTTVDNANKTTGPKQRAKPIPKKPSIQTVTSLDGLELEAVTRFGSSNVAVFSNRGLGAVQRLSGERIGTFVISNITPNSVTVKSIVDNETYVIKPKG